MLAHRREFGEQIWMIRIFSEGFRRVGDSARTTFSPIIKIAGKTAFFDFRNFYNSAKEHPTREIF